MAARCQPRAGLIMPHMSLMAPGAALRPARTHAGHGGRSRRYRSRILSKGRKFDFFRLHLRSWRASQLSTTPAC
eukprot:3240465-Prymnesium_polylepis.1